MRILALEPYYGGSHRAFLDGWLSHSRHDWTLLTLPAHNWKWRMRHSAVTLANDVSSRVEAGNGWDLLFCSDMLNLAEFRGLVDPAVACLPTVAYFHENQLTYPARFPTERDLHFAFTNFTTALAADQVWFNSGFHQAEFLQALKSLLARMPDHQPLDEVERIQGKSCLQWPGIDWPQPRSSRMPGPLRILWAARWEHDKDPDTFFAALNTLRKRDVPFRISVIGERFREAPSVFDDARRQFSDCIDRWGFQESRDEYAAALREADVIVSTAQHEFFGLAVVEAIAAGAYPLLPKRLSYPELLDIDADPARCARFFYDGSVEELAARLEHLAARVIGKELWTADPNEAREIVARFRWSEAAARMDEQLCSVQPQDS